MAKLYAICLLIAAGFLNSYPLKPISIEKFLDNAEFDALCTETDELLFMRRDRNGVFQLFTVNVYSKDPESEKICISLNPKKSFGIEAAMIPEVHKGASDWHPSGEWFITEVEIPYNPSWKYKEKLPKTRLLAEPGAGWWNNLFLVKKDGSIWIKLTDFTYRDLNSGVLYPKFSKDGKMILWAEKIGGAKPFDKYPFAKWVLKITEINFKSTIPYIQNIKTIPLEDGSIFEPQEWSKDNKILFAGDIGYSTLSYPAYRMDLWEAKVNESGNVINLKNLTKTKNFYEEQASYSPDEKFIAFMSNQFDLNYEKRLEKAWNKFRTKHNNFITKNLTTDLYIMDRDGRILGRLTNFAEKNWGDNHPLVTRSTWCRDGKTLFINITLRSNYNGEKTAQSIYKLNIKY